MFELAKNQFIGRHLSKLIDKKFKSVRQFGKAYIEAEGRIADGEEMRKMSNRLSQILSGKKSLQIYDLPIFTKILDVSCEEILSAGKCFSTSSNHLTNYSIATSKNKGEWNAYINKEEQPILNADEYGKTVIDYALDFENYEFLKFLMDEGYIWFVGADEKDLFNYDFGAGTSIERNPLLLHNLNVLDAKLKERYDLRMKMIILAIKRNDTKMLTDLRAREIPSLYQACCYSCTPAKCEKYFDSELIEALSNASDEILEYFSKEFEITDRIGFTNRFMFPFIGKLIEALLECNNDFVQWVLKDAITHNQYAYDRLAEMMDKTAEYYKKIYSDSLSYSQDDLVKGIMRELDFYDDGDLVSYRAVAVKDGIITNLVKVKATSDDIKTKRLIQELNELHDKIQNITPNL